MSDVTRSSTGLAENVAGLLCYAFTFVSGFVMLLVEKESRFVRFHAAQSIVVFIGLPLISLLSAFMPLVGFAVAAIVGPLTVVLWIVLMYKAGVGEHFKLPIAGDLAETILAKTKV